MTRAPVEAANPAPNAAARAPSWNWPNCGPLLVKMLLIDDMRPRLQSDPSSRYTTAQRKIFFDAVYRRLLWLYPATFRREYGDRNLYRRNFRAGFEAGYAQGYRQYDRGYRRW